MDIALTINGLEKRYKGFQLGPLDLELQWYGHGSDWGPWRG